MNGLHYMDTPVITAQDCNTKNNAGNGHSEHGGKLHEALADELLLYDQICNDHREERSKDCGHQAQIHEIGKGLGIGVHHACKVLEGQCEILTPELKAYAQRYHCVHADYKLTYQRA